VAPLAVPVEDAAEDGVLLAPESLHKEKIARKNTMRILEKKTMRTRKNPIVLKLKYAAR
jgi:hypothetical protein